MLVCKDKTNNLNLPSYNVKLDCIDGKEVIYDLVREKWVTLTPEEWVRQHFTHFLIEHLGYPLLAFSTETLVKDSSRRSRTDTIIYGNEGKAWILIEYKAPTLTLNKNMWQQLLNYNFTYKAPFLVLSNGLQHIICHINYKTNSYTFLKEIPPFATLYKGIENLSLQ